MRRLLAAALLGTLLAGCPAPLLPLAPTVPSATPARPVGGTPRPTATPARTRWRTNSLVGFLTHADGRKVGSEYHLRIHTGPASTIAFTAEAPVAAGSYGVTGVPSQTSLILEVVKGGQAVVTRTVKFTGLEARAVASFGGDVSDDDPNARLFPVP